MAEKTQWIRDSYHADNWDDFLDKTQEPLALSLSPLPAVNIQRY